MRARVSSSGMMPKTSSASISAVATVWIWSEAMSSMIEPLASSRPWRLLKPPIASAASTSITQAVPLGKTNFVFDRSSSTAAGIAVSLTTEDRSSSGFFLRSFLRLPAADPRMLIGVDPFDHGTQFAWFMSILSLLYRTEQQLVAIRRFECG